MIEMKKKYGFKWSEALRVGIGVLLSQRGVRDYQGPVNMERKIQAISNKLDEKSREAEESVKERDMIKNELEKAQIELRLLKKKHDII